MNETILFGGLYRSRLGCGLDPHILSVGGVTVKYSLLIAASNNLTKPEMATILSRIFEQFSAGVVNTSSLMLVLLLMMHSQFVRNFSAAAPVH